MDNAHKVDSGNGVEETVVMGGVDNGRGLRRAVSMGEVNSGNGVE